MSDPRPFLWLIPALPLVAAVITPFLGSPRTRRLACWPCILTAAAACVLSFAVLASFRSPPGEHESGSQAVWKHYYCWFAAGELDVGFTLRADPLTAVMLVTVTLISTLIAVYSVGYMHDDEGYARFFAEIALFIFSMTGLVLADNFLLLYAFWEGVGLCSYLLIGFWFTRPAAAAAARKAFLVTRLGDVGLLLGILLLWARFGYHVDYDGVFAAAPAAPARTTVACLLLFCGAAGKSAQFPLHVWLPDAMEGPTPVSALIHAATMVTAGVYLVARCSPLFVLAPAAQLVVGCIGGLTALLAATMALTQTDLKRVLAYSTISQLGYMFVALGAGGAVAAIFHLLTHAFFKALLFLAAGSVMHALGGVIDMRRFSGLRRVMPITHATFLCGAAALAGVPFITSGFWSKDEILGSVLASSRGGHPGEAVYLALFIIGVLTAAITAFYTFRAYFKTFWGPERVPEEAHGHAHESPAVMWVPLVLLAVGALAAGFVNAEPLTDWLAVFLRHTAALSTAPHAEPSGVGMRAMLWGLSAVASLGGIALAGWIYLARPGVADRMARSMEFLYALSRNRFYLDEVYDLLIVRPLWGLAELCRVVDQYLIDGLVDFFAQVPRAVGLAFRPVQNGLVQFYALAMILGLATLLGALAWGWATGTGAPWTRG